MLIENLIKKLEKEFPLSFAEKWDSIGMQVISKNTITKIIVLLDVSLETINQAIFNKVDLIISHHPLFFDENNDDKLILEKINLLKTHNIGLYVIHTNADFNENSISKNHIINTFPDGKVFKSKNLLEVHLERKIGIAAIIELLKNKNELNSIDFRANINNDDKFEVISFSSGAGASLIINEDGIDLSILYIIGEVKYHEWQKISDLNMKVLEISHYSEHIFKKMILNVLIDENIEIILGRENNVYRTI